jgi:hypothetical protein
LAVLAGLVPLSGCPARRSPAEALATSPDYAQSTGQAKCGVKASARKPLVVEWPGADRSELESRASRNLVVVRYEGCDMEVLSHCSVAGNYHWLPVTPKREAVRIHDADELYAELPVGAAGLEAKLKRSGQLNVDMVIIGRKEADAVKFTERELEGRCEDATHVITGLTVGAFSFYAGAAAEIGAGVEVGNIAAGASSGHEREVLKQDGDGAACSGSTSDSEGPPDGCGALLRVEVVPIDRVFGVSRQVAPDGSSTTVPAAPTATPADTSIGVDPELDRKIRTWRTITFTSYGLAAAGAIGLVLGPVMIRKAETDLRGLGMMSGNLPVGSAERRDLIRRGQVWEGVTIGAGVATGVFAILAIVGQARLKRLQADKRTAVMPTGLGIEGRF